MARGLVTYVHGDSSGCRTRKNAKKHAAEREPHQRGKLWKFARISRTALIVADDPATTLIHKNHLV
jgi:hypothetical protein